ncbi:MAG: hypothetical protein F7C35_02760 [Desulfurococcales archaeon]|nr:hypothetical protein [Desulfurococcales archaeon]
MLVYEDEASEIEEGEVGANTEEFLAGVGKIVRRIEEKGAKAAEEPEEITEYGVVIYTVSSRIVEYMLEQVDLYDRVLSGELPLDQALELVKKSHAEALEILKADMKPATKKTSKKKTKKKTTKKKTTKKSKSKKKAKKTSSNSSE